MPPPGNNRVNVGGILIVPLKVSAPNCPVYLLSEKFCLISASFQVCSFVLVLRGKEWKFNPETGKLQMWRLESAQTL